VNGDRGLPFTVWNTAMGITNVYSIASSDKTERRQFLQHTPSKEAASLALPATADDIDTLLAAHAAAEAEASAAGTIEQTPAWEAAAQKCNELYDAIVNARPTDPVAMAKQIRFLIHDSTDREDQMLAHIADQLEAMRLAVR
jgi:hypothetical protein